MVKLTPCPLKAGNAIARKTQLSYFVNIDTYLPGQMSRELDPGSVSSLCHGTTENTAI